MKRRKANWIGNILRRSCVLEHVIDWKDFEGRKEVKVRRGRRRKQILNVMKEKR
jgi:hypothetical protein